MQFIWSSVKQNIHNNPLYSTKETNLWPQFQLSIKEKAGKNPDYRKKVYFSCKGSGQNQIQEKNQIRTQLKTLTN